MEDNTPILERNGEKYQQLITALGSISLHGANEHLEPGQIYSNWERYGAVKDPPRFSEQFSDETRQAPFRYGPAALEKANMGWLATEYEGLQEVRHLLGGHISNARSEDAPMVARAVDMLRNLTFIGEREYDEAVQGIGTAWKAYLDAHPRNQLCVITEINKLDRYEGQRKSDEHLKQRILETFTDQELARYSGRIVERVEDMTANARRGRVVLLDDWTVTGRQMHNTYRRLMGNPAFRRFANAGNAEINVVVASADRIKNGLPISQTNSRAGAIPVRAYYQAHYAETARETAFSYITGLHSSVNYGFGFTVDSLVTRQQGEEAGLPMLSHIIRDYRTQVSTIAIEASRLYRIDPGLVSRNKAVVQSGAIAVSGTIGSEGDS